MCMRANTEESAPNVNDCLFQHRHLLSLNNLCQDTFFFINHPIPPHSGFVELKVTGVKHLVQIIRGFVANTFHFVGGVQEKSVLLGMEEKQGRYETAMGWISEAM